MKTTSWSLLAVLVLATVLYTVSVPRLGEMRQERRERQVFSLGEIPSQVVEALSFEFKGVVADYLMLQAMTFTGERIGANKPFEKDEWQYLYRRLDTITDIDPRFWDPYLLAESMLVWQAGMVEEGNQLLLKAAQHRPQDFRPYYFVGFNYFYFLKDSEKAAPFMRKAAQIPGAPFYLQGLAARFSLYGNDTSTAIFFLDSMLRDTFDPKVRQYLEKRLKALVLIHDLEKKVQAYAKTKGSLPSSLEDLVTTGLLDKLPADPYGGTFVLLENGRVYTTSKLADGPAKKEGTPEKGE